MTKEQSGKAEKKPAVNREKIIGLTLATPDPESPTQRKYKVIDEALAEIVYADLLTPNMSPRRRAQALANGVINIGKTRDRIVTEIMNHPYLQGLGLKKMDRFLAELSGLNPGMEFTGPEDYTALFNQEVLGAKTKEEQTFTGEIFDPTAPPKFEPGTFREEDWNMTEFVKNLTGGKKTVGPIRHMTSTPPPFVANPLSNKQRE